MASAPAAVLNILVDVNNGRATAKLVGTQEQLAATRGEAAALSKTSVGTGGALRKLGTAAKWGGAALAVGFVVEAKKAVETTQDLAKTTISLNQNLGIGVKKSSEWANVLKARGVDTTKAGMAFKTFATQVDAAVKGSSTSIAMFKELGISQKDLAKNQGNVQKLLLQTSDGINKLGAGTARTTAESKLFGRGWQTMAPVLRDGSAALKEQLATTEKYGAYLTTKGLKAQQDLLASQRESKIAWQGLQIQLGSALTPALIKVEDQFQRIARIMSSNKLTRDEKISKIGHIIQTDFQKALDFVLKLIPKFASRVGQTAPKIAIALVQGFLKADVWGKLFLGAWLIKKLGLGRAIFSAVGKRLGISVATNVAAGAASGEAVAAASTAGTALGTALGTAMGVAGIAIAAKMVSDWLDNLSPTSKSHAFGEPGLPGRQGGGSHLGLLPIPFTGGGSGGGLLERLFGTAFSDKSRKQQRLIELEPFTHAFKLVSKQITVLKGEYGSLGNAAKHMSDAQLAGWIKAAHAANDNGKLSDHATEHLIQILHNAGGQAGDTANKVKAGADKGAKAVEDGGKKSEKALSDVGKAHGRTADAAKAASNKEQNAAKDAASTTAKSSNTIGDKLRAAQKAGSRAMAALEHNLGISTHGMAHATFLGFGNIEKNTNKALKALKAGKPVTFGMSDAPAAPAGGTRAYKRGGVLEAAKGAMVPGAGSGDKVPLHVGGQLAAMVEPGEFVSVANRTATSALMGANRRIPRRAKGGDVQSPYRFPLGPGYSWGRTDMGVDFGGSFNIGAIGAGRVFDSGPQAGWPPPGSAQGVSYTMAAGAPKGYSPSSANIYVKESLSPRIGTGNVKAGQLIARALGTSTGIEMGWADTGGQPIAAPIYSEGDVTAAGSSFKRFLQDIAGGKGVMGGGGAAGAVWKNIARAVLTGPDGPLKREGQAALDIVWRAANAYGRKHVPQGTTGSVGRVFTGSKKGFQPMVASWYGPLPTQGPHPVGAGGVPIRGDMFAELGMGNAMGHLPMGAKVAVAYHGKTLVGTKEDIGLGGSGGQKIDLWTEFADDLGFDKSKGLDTVMVKRLKDGGVLGQVPHLAAGGKVGFFGDSLGVGMEPYLPGDWYVNTVGGRGSAATYSQLQSHLGGKNAIVWEMGANDSAATYKSYLGKVDKNIGARGLALMTLAGVPQAGSENAAMKADKRKDALANWAGIAGKYHLSGPHTDSTGYRAMAKKVRSAAARALKAAGKGGGGGGSTGHHRGRRRPHVYGAGHGRDPSTGGHQIYGSPAVPQGWKNKLGHMKYLRQLEQIITELYDVASRRSAYESSELGTDLGPTELATLLHFDRALLGDYIEERNMAEHLLNSIQTSKLTGKPAAFGKRIAGGLRSRLVELQGLTGESGLIFDVREDIKNLKGSVPVDTGPDLSAELALQQQLTQEAQQRLAVSQAQYPVFAGAFAKGGPIPAGAWGIAGEQGPEAVFGPATVLPSSGATAPQVNITFAEGMEWLRQFMSVEVQAHQRGAISHARRSVNA